MRHFSRCIGIFGVFSGAMLVAFSSFAATIDLQGVNKGSTNYFGGPLNGWNELEFIPCRVVVNSAGSNQVVVNFNNNANNKPGIQNLFYFTPSSNIVMSTPILTGSSAIQDWYYTFNVNVTNPPGYIYYQARMAAGAHLFGGASLHMYNPQLQLAKPVPAAGVPDLVITKTGPVTVFPGQTITYSVTFSNKLTAVNAAVGVEIYDTLPTGMTYANTWSGSAGVQFFQALGNELWWDLPDLQPGDSGTLTYQVVVGTGLANGLVLQNYAQILSTQNDANMADNVSVVTSTVSAIQPPTAANDIYSVNQNQTLTIASPGVLANDSDPNGLTLKALLVTNVAVGTLTLSTNGSFTYVPPANFSGTVYFYYVATNGTAASQPAKVTINVFHFAAPADSTLSCVTSMPAAATNLTQFLAQGGVDGGPYCGQPTVANFVSDSSNGGAGCAANPLVITRAYKLTTGCGDVTNVVQKFTVIDTTAPTITAFPADATYSCTGQVPAANDSLVAGTDNCSGVTVTHNVDIITSSNCVNRITVSRTYVLTDSCGNSTSRTQTITVNGTTAPFITSLPVDATYSCAGSVPAANDSLVSATNACGGGAGIVISHSADSVTSSNCVNRFTITRTFIATDACGNSSSKSQTITINATVVPTIVTFPADLTVSCASVVPVADDGGVAATNACGGSNGVTISHAADTISASNCVNRFTVSRTYVATDACGNSSSKTQMITVNGTMPPTISTFPGDVTIACASAVPGPSDASVAAVDNCGGAGVTVTHDADVLSSSNCASHFTLTRTYHVTDACGNATTKSQQITVNQTNTPIIVGFPADVTVSCASAVPAPDDSSVSGTDACGTSSLTISHLADAIGASNCVSRFVISRTYVATDACGNSSTKIQTITVNATIPPAITAFPADATYSCPSAVPGPSDALLAATDSCGTGAPVMVTHDADVVSSSNCVSRFTITRTYRVIDACGNATTKAQLITVNATIAPTIAGFPADATYLCASAVPEANDRLVSATDACGAVGGLVITHAPDVVSSSNCVSRFTISRAYIATDACGNSSSKVQTLTVNGTTPPTITAFPGDATYACAGAVPVADDTLVTAVDNCGGAAPVTIGHDADVFTSSNCVNRFTITRTYHATDACGNVASKNQTITVNATIAPVITTFPDDATYSCASAVPAADDSLVSAVDNCGANSSATIMHNADVVAPGVCANRFTISRTYIATDACGNSSSRTQTISVNQVTPPTITTFPLDATFSCANAVPAPDDSLVNAADGCGGGNVVITHTVDSLSSSNCVNRFTITRTYVATDTCGNSSSKSQVIIVNGTTAPTITTFPADATFSCVSAVSVADDALVAATDNCGGVSGVPISHDADLVTSSNCANQLVITRTYHATDVCGNVATKSQTITVNSTTAPTIVTFPADATYSCPSDVPSANDGLITAADACGGTLGMQITHDSDVLVTRLCTNSFTLSRSYRVTDLCGNVTAKSQLITVSSTVAPTIVSYPQDATYSCASAVPAPTDSSITAIDQCGGKTTVAITHDADIVISSNCVSKYTITRTYHATDACGNMSTVAQHITINATNTPTITAFPPDATYSCATSVPPPNDGMLSAIDSCGGAGSVIITHAADLITSSNCVNRFAIARTYIATDACGNSSSQTQIITVNGTTPPIITTFPADVTYSCANAVPAAGDALVAATNACGGSSGLVVTHGIDLVTSSNCVNRFVITRAYTVTDACGNSSSRTQTITVNGVTAPTITTLPPDATYSCAGAIPAADNTLVAATDGCGSASEIAITHGADIVTSSNCVNRFTINRTYTATDACGNSSSKTQTITVNGTTPPFITAFPADATFSCATAIPAADDSSVAATNACGGVAGVLITHATDVIISSNCVNRFVISRAYIATDACGNSSSKTQTITVNGTIPPTITTFPADITFACSTSVPGPNDSLVAAQDNCGGASVVITHDADVITSSNCLNHFSITRTYRATDACGNVTSKSQTIVVNDSQTPTISCPAPITVSLPIDIPAPDTALVLASDNCSVPQKSFVSDQYSTNGYVVTITRTYAATDDCGNRSTCAQVITFNPLLAKPTANADSYSVLENKVLNVSAPGVLVNDTDPNNLPLQAVLVSGPTNGSLILSTNGSFQFTPKTYYFGLDTFKYQASNTGTPSDPVTVTIDVGFVNQQPSFTKGPDISVLEDSALSITTNWATNIQPGPVNEANQSLNFIVSNDNSNLFTAQPSLLANGTLTFAPVPLTIGSANVTVQLHDNGGTDNGGVDTSVSQTFVITVIPVNHAPSFVKGADQLVNNYAGAQTRLNWATAMSPGPANESWQTLNFIVSNGNNSIFSSAPAISPTGTLMFAPATNKYGSATVSVALHDNGGTANGGKDTSAVQTFSILVNNPPIVAINMPTNTSLFLYPSPVTIIADAYDLDGYVTNVTFLNGTNVIGQGTTDGDDVYTLAWTNAPATNCVLYALAYDNYGATNISAPINIQLGNPVTVSGGPISFSPSLFTWGQKLTVTNPTISTVQSITVTFTSISSGTSVQGVTGTNSLGQPYIVFNSTVPPATVVSNYATILYVSGVQPVVTFVTSASLTPGPIFTINATNIVKVTRDQFQSDGSFLLNFLSSSNKTYYVQYTSDCVNWLTSPLPLKGNGTQLQWVDIGPGVTQLPPRKAPYRFYRVVAP